MAAQSDPHSAATPIPPGKVPTELLAGLLAGPLPPEVRIGPSIGEDACAIDIPAGALVVATDPITLTSSDLGRAAVIVNANDVAVMGVRPSWFLAAVLLPLGSTRATLEEVFATMRAALDEVGAVLVGGHTEVTSAVNQPVVVGQMIGHAHNGRVITTSGASPGEVVVQVGPVPIEGAAVLAAELGQIDGVAEDVHAAARAALHDPGISIVDAALTAVSLGATAMHDPTEGGLASGLHELALAAGVGIHIDAAKVLWFGPGVAICRAVGADAWATLASGALLATFPRHRAAEAVTRLVDAGRPAAVIGDVVHRVTALEVDGASMPWPTRDEVARILAAERS